MKLFSNILFAKIYPESDKVPFRVRGTGYVRNDPATRQKMRGHFCAQQGEKVIGARSHMVELFWCVGGGCTFHYPEGTYTLHPGEVCFYNSGCLHDYIPLDSGFEYHWLSIEGAQAEKFFQGFHTSRLPRHVGTCPDDLFTLLRTEMSIPDSRSVYRAFATGLCRRGAAYGRRKFHQPGNHGQFSGGTTAAQPLLSESAVSWKDRCHALRIYSAEASGIRKGTADPFRSYRL